MAETVAGQVPRPGAVRVKVCGITRLEDALAAAGYGASALGFVFWPGSPRYVAPEVVARFVPHLPPFVARVGVFVEASPAEVAAVAARAGLTAVQLYGGPDLGPVNPFALSVIRAIGVAEGFDVAGALAVPEPVTLLLDRADPGRHGGTGQTIDWTAAAEVAAARRVILAGGLTAANVAAAIRRVRPYGVDVASGVERAPGIKDPQRLREFFEAVTDGSRGGMVPASSA